MLSTANAWEEEICDFNGASLVSSGVEPPQVARVRWPGPLCFMCPGGQLGF